MKLSLRYRHHSPSPTFAALIGQQFESLGAARHIDEARVLIEHRLEASPAFRVAAHLVTPGPDIAVEAVDHTLRAALSKVIVELKAHIGRRKLKRSRRRGAPMRTALPARAAWAGCRA